jgi:hypothetical protein
MAKPEKQTQPDGYEPPALEILGPAEDLTQGLGPVSRPDATSPFHSSF